jgi:hypothetical protein
MEVKELYDVFASTFPNLYEFWGRMAEEENVHARLLQRLRGVEDISDKFFKEMHLSQEVIKRSIAYVEDKRKLTLKGQIDVQQAFSLAENIERFLIDGVFIKLEDKAHIQILKIMMALAEDTKKHIRVVLETQERLFQEKAFTRAG